MRIVFILLIAFCTQYSISQNSAEHCFIIDSLDAYIDHTYEGNLIIHKNKMLYDSIISHLGSDDWSFYVEDNDSYIVNGNSFYIIEFSLDNFKSKYETYISIYSDSNYQLLIFYHSKKNSIRFPYKIESCNFYCYKKMKKGRFVISMKLTDIYSKSFQCVLDFWV